MHNGFNEADETSTTSEPSQAAMMVRRVSTVALSATSTMVWLEPFKNNCMTLQK
jgi:hypothetical protein